jgi:hypothetical protein
MSTEKIREDRQRRRLTKAGYRLCKTPARSWLRHDHGVGYMILLNHLVVDGFGSRTYMMTLEEVEAFITPS